MFWVMCRQHSGNTMGTWAKVSIEDQGKSKPMHRFIEFRLPAISTLSLSHPVNVVS